MIQRTKTMATASASGAYTDASDQDNVGRVDGADADLIGRIT